MFRYLTLLICIYTCLNAKAQGLEIQDFHTGKVVTNDTVFLYFYENGFFGWQSLNLELKVTNKSADTMLVGARKREYSPMNNVSHTICFAGGCYIETTFVSPNLAYLFPTQTDSSFSAHYLYNDNNHTPCVDQASYTFYNAAKPEDSAIVYVQYNTYHRLGAYIADDNDKLRDPFPNPAQSFLLIPFKDPSSRSISLYNSLGALVKNELSTAYPTYQLDLKGLSEGIYYLKIDVAQGCERTLRIVIDN